MKIGINYETPEYIERMQNIILTFYNDFFPPSRNNYVNRRAYTERYSKSLFCTEKYHKITFCFLQYYLYRVYRIGFKYKPRHAYIRGGVI